MIPAPPPAPVMELRDRNWVVENYKKTEEPIEIKEAQKNQSVCVRDSTGIIVKIPEKVNNVVVEGCQDTGVILSSVISNVELLNSKNVKVQVENSAPTVAIDNCSGVTVYLSKDSRETEISSCMSTDMNVVFPSEKDPDELIEKPIPQQFISVIKNDKITTQPSLLY